MSVKRIFIVVVFALVFAFITAFLRQNNNYFFETTDQDEEKEISGHLDSLSIEALKKTKIDSSDIKIEQNLPDKTGYKQFIASYLSEGLTQFALLTSFMGIPRVIISAPTGYLAQSVGWTGFFVICGLVAIPGLLMLTKFAPWSEKIS